MAIGREERARGDARTGGELAYQTNHDTGSGVPVSTILCEAIAAVEGVDVTELDIRLYDHIDVDALNALFDSARTDWRLEFDVGEYAVSVRSDGEITVFGGE